ncbi:hypothetical protein PIIN_11038 [Serendipita indica DSM 11827]|uniref:Uncharacterized protein n=1 Tax=Serendipita indica (strain DSM 11827) TaxID=1109443 RepID=G4U0G0_SERID|nr:hypothetical protein PIIN_11038 [Serendipita indica DSM 11827]
MTRVHGSIGLIDWGEAEDDDGWQLAIMMNDAHDQNGIGRRDLRHAHGVEVGWGGGEQVEELPNSLAQSGSGSSAGRPIVSTSRRKNGQQASANQDQASSSNKARTRRRKGKQGPNYQTRPHRNHYDDKEEFSEDENDDFGVADWDYDYADVNWEAF